MNGTGLRALAGLRATDQPAGALMPAAVNLWAGAIVRIVIVVVGLITTACSIQNPAQDTDAGAPEQFKDQPDDPRPCPAGVNDKERRVGAGG